MLNMIVCEFGKLKRKKLFRIAFLTTFVMPLLYFLILDDTTLENMMSVVKTDNAFLLLIPFSVVLAANLFFEEHDCDTLKNLMCIPVTKGRLTLAKLFVILIFDIGYELAGGISAVLLTAISGESLEGLWLEIFLAAGSGILIWAAAMPCILFVVWCNRSYIISVIIAFAYTVINYILHVNDSFIMVPIGFNIPTLLPVPMISRWLYQYHSLEDAGQEMIDFYNRFRPYFVSTPVIFAMLLGEAAVCVMLMIQVYRKQSV